MDPNQTTLIVGGGTFGISTAYHLAQHHPNPSNITILDRAPAPSQPAASTDLNKIIRADYTSPLYMKLGFEAIAAWKSLPCLANAGVYHLSGWLSMNEKGSDVQARIRKNFHNSGREDVISDLEEEDVRSRWGGVFRDTDCTPFGSYSINPLAGWADAGRALEIMTREVVGSGVKYNVGEARRVIIGQSGGVQGVETADGQVYTADRVVLATGAWTSQLMASVEDDLSLAEQERVERQVTAAGVCVAHFQLSEKEADIYSQMPVMVYGGQGEVIPPTDSGILKFTFTTSFKNTIPTPSGYSISVPPNQSQLDAPRGLQEDSLAQIRRRIPQLLANDRKPDYYRLCWDSISPDQQPLITQHPDARLSNLYLAVGGSFHCYKFLPIIGKYVVNVLNGVSNGPEKDAAWGWKRGGGSARGVHESLVPDRELSEFV